MIGVTFCGIFLTPVFYVVLRAVSDFFGGRREQAAGQPQFAKDERIPVASGHP
jgi:hypothetical protein